MSLPSLPIAPGIPGVRADRVEVTLLPTDSPHINAVREAARAAGG